MKENKKGDEVIKEARECERGDWCVGKSGEKRGEKGKERENKER
jgi:hypothetical protein